jgi:hypothetical protein
MPQKTVGILEIRSIRGIRDKKAVSVAIEPHLSPTMGRGANC